MPYPLDTGEQVEDIRIIASPSRVEALIEVYRDAPTNDLLYLLQAEVGGKDVVVEQYGTPLIADKLGQRRCRTYRTLLARHDAPRAAVDTTARDKSIRLTHAIQRIVWAHMLDLVGQDSRVIMVSRACLDDLTRVMIRAVGREREDLRHVDFIVAAEHRIGELYQISLRLMPCRELHKRQIRVMMPVYVNESDFHNLPYL